jgi:hypothetical protein
MKWLGKVYCHWFRTYYTKVITLLCNRGTGFVVLLYYVPWYLRKWVFRYSVLVYCVLL